MPKRGRSSSSRKTIGHVTHGSVLDDLGIPADVLASFKVRAWLHSDIYEIASKYSQAELQDILQESQPRISDFMRGKVTKFSLDTLLLYAYRLKMRPEIKTKNHTHRFEEVGVG